MKETDVQEAVDQTGFGKFNVKITAVGALIYLNCAFCITSVGFVNSTAACDYKMTTIDKGRINVTLTIGMVIGTFVWGCLSDLKGRRGCLLISLYMQFVVDALAAVVPSYSAIVFLKIFSGIGITGQMSIMFPYIGEFQPNNYRSQIMSWMELFWSFGLILVPLLAWAVVPLKFAFRTPQFWFSSWNLFALLCAIPSLMIALYLLTLPETPKFLAESDQLDVLLKVLTRMAAENTGQSADQFKETLSKSGISSLSELVLEPKQRDKTRKNTTMSKSAKLNEMMTSFKSQVKMLIRKTYITRLFITSSIVFCMSSTYFSLMIWFPELFQRFAAFEKDFPNESASVCSISQKFAANYNSTNATSHDQFGCDTPIHISVYINSMWLGVACFPAAILLPLTVDRFGYRVYLISTAIIASVMTIGFFFVKSSTQNLVLSAIFEACTSINVSIIFCLLVEIFPTSVRVLASAITILMSRIGTLFGNMIFSYLIDDHCAILISVMVAELIFATAICWLTPSNSRIEKVKRDDAIEQQTKL